MKYPKINLAIDNCFAVKRWVKPHDWAKIIADMNIQCVEISADCECDPLYSDADYLTEWQHDVKNACTEHSIRVTSMYSGHGTYTTVGLAHSDNRMRKRFTDEWILPYAEMASEFNSGMGFYMHAFSNDILQNKEKYSLAYAELSETIKNACRDAREKGAAFTAVEQMYSPQQLPWTISGTLRFINDTKSYITIDTGHASGQRNFIRPSMSDILHAAENGHRIYVGTDYSCALLKSLIDGSIGELKRDKAIYDICSDIALHDYMFSENSDCDLYKWIERLAVYSPIIHLQQTDGSASSHRSFTPEENINGIVKPSKVLKAIKDSYDYAAVHQEITDVPLCEEITLTLELFYNLTDTTDKILDNLRASADYWRRYIPYDGMYLDDVLDLI